MWADQSYFHFIYSPDGGETWEVDGSEYEYTGLAHPSIDIEGGYIYVCAVKSVEPPKVGTYTEFKWGPEGSEEVNTKNLGMAYPVSDIEAIGESIYIAALSSGGPNASKDIFFWRSDDRGKNWSIDRKKLGDYYGDFFRPPDDWLDLSVYDDHVGLSWTDNDDISDK